MKLRKLWLQKNQTEANIWLGWGTTSRRCLEEGVGSMWSATVTGRVVLQHSGAKLIGLQLGPNNCRDWRLATCDFIIVSANLGCDRVKESLVRWLIDWRRISWQFVRWDAIWLHPRGQHSSPRVDIDINIEFCAPVAGLAWLFGWQPKCSSSCGYGCGCVCHPSWSNLTRLKPVFWLLRLQHTRRRAASTLWPVVSHIWAARWRFATGASRPCPASDPAPVLPVPVFPSHNLPRRDAWAGSQLRYCTCLRVDLQWRRLWHENSKR